MTLCILLSEQRTTLTSFVPSLFPLQFPFCGTGREESDEKSPTMDTS